MARCKDSDYIGVRFLIKPEKAFPHKRGLSHSEAAKGGIHATHSTGGLKPAVGV